MRTTNLKLCPNCGENLIQTIQDKQIVWTCPECDETKSEPVISSELGNREFKDLVITDARNDYNRQPVLQEMLERWRVTLSQLVIETDTKIINLKLELNIIKTQQVREVLLPRLKATQWFLARLKMRLVEVETLLAPPKPDQQFKDRMSEERKFYREGLLDLQQEILKGNLDPVKLNSLISTRLNYKVEA